MAIMLEIDHVLSSVLAHMHRYKMPIKKEDSVINIHNLIAICVAVKASNVECSL